MNYNDIPEPPRMVTCPACGGTQIDEFGIVCRKCDDGEVFEDESDKYYDWADARHSEGRTL